MGAFITQPDVIHEARHAAFTAQSWLRTHQISWYGTWHFLPLALALTNAEHVFHFCLSLRTRSVPRGNDFRLTASAFEWKGALPNHPMASIAFCSTGLVLQSNGVGLATFPFPTPTSHASLDSLEPPGWTLRSTKGTYFFAAATFNQEGHEHPTASSLLDPTDEAFPPNMVQWPTVPPTTVPPPVATQEQRNPVPTWLPSASQQLFSQGLETLTNPATIAASTPQDWIPAYCAHALSGFTEEHLPLLRTPDLLESFSASMATPIVEQQPDQAQDYLQSIITAYDRSWQPTTRRHRVRPVAGPPDDAHCHLFNNNTLPKPTLYIDNLYNKLAELSTLLAGQDISKSPDGWVRLSTLKTYDGVDVLGNRPAKTSLPATLSQSAVVATSKI